MLRRSSCASLQGTVLRGRAALPAKSRDDHWTGEEVGGRRSVPRAAGLPTGGVSSPARNPGLRSLHSLTLGYQPAAPLGLKGRW
jgi:hypothetical protein